MGLNKPKVVIDRPGSKVKKGPNRNSAELAPIEIQS